MRWIGIAIVKTLILKLFSCIVLQVSGHRNNNFFNIVPSKIRNNKCMQ